MNKIKNHPYILFSSILSLGLGLLFIFINPESILNFIYYSLGFMLILLGVFKFMLSRRNSIDTYNGILNIVVGILLIFFHNFIVTIILGLLFLIFPILRIINSPYKKETFKSELPLIVVGVVVCFSGDLFANVFFKVLGGLFILFAIYQFVSIFSVKLRMVKIQSDDFSNENNIRKNVVDVTYEEGEIDE